MRKGIEVRLGPGDCERREVVIGSGNSLQKNVWRARIVVLSADGVGTTAIQSQPARGKPTIWHWQARLMAAVDEVLHDTAGPQETEEPVEKKLEAIAARGIARSVDFVARGALARRHAIPAICL
jgi:hypothetical protein